jgi:hypothetical protein
MSDIHPDLESIMEDAVASLVDESKSKLMEDFKTMEESLYKSNGDPDVVHEMWAAVMVADNVQDMKTYINDNPKVPVVNNVPEDVANEEAGLLGLLKVGEGPDIYEPLESIEAAIATSQVPNLVGVVIRCGGWAKPVQSEDDGLPPSKSPDRVNSVITVMVTSSYIMTACRSVDDGEDTEVVYQQTKLSEWEFDVSQLGDALIKFFVFPRKLKKDHPEMYEQIAQQVMDSIPDDDE